jgi:drug/metabolite transporter (DMT)-like permease
MVLFWTQPISAILLARVFNGETLDYLQMISVAMAMLGVVLLTNPQILSSNKEESEIEFELYPHFYAGVFVSLMGSLMTGAAYLKIRQMGSEVNSNLGPLYFGVFSAITVHVLMIVTEDPLQEPYTLYGCFLLLLLGLCMLFGQLFVSKSMQVE